MALNDAFVNLTDEQKDRARALKTPEELMTFVQEEGVELSEDQLEAISGGDWNNTHCSGYEKPVIESN